MKKLILLLFIPLVFGCGASNEEIEKIIKNEIIKAVEKDDSLRYSYFKLDSFKNSKKKNKEFMGSLKLTDERFAYLNEIEYDSEELYFDGAIFGDSVSFFIDGSYRSWFVRKSISDDKLREYSYYYKIKDSLGKVVRSGEKYFENRPDGSSYSLVSSDGKRSSVVSNKN